MFLNLNVIYTIIVVIGILFITAKVLDVIFNYIYGTDDTKKSNITLLIECSVQLALTGCVCYIVRRLIDKLPTPFNEKIKLKDFISNNDIYTFIILIF